jgi:hypothetical protein
MLLAEGDRVTLKGLTGARIFRRGKDPVEAALNSEIFKLVHP